MAPRRNPVIPTENTPWTEAEYEKLVDMRFPLQMPVDLIAECLPGRTYTATRAKLNKILRWKRREAADAANAAQSDSIPANAVEP